VDRVEWPFRANRRSYLLIGAFPLAVGGWCWNILMNFRSTGDAAPLPFLPLLNPLDLSEAIITVVVALWILRLRREEPESIGEQIFVLRLVFYGTLFFWLNAVIVRTVHHWGGVAFSLEAMFASFLFQSVISLVWCITAFCSMTLAARKRMRTVWIVGAVILGAVVLKLFLIDLSGKGTIERIVSFVGVGALILVIGWFSPVPPRIEQEVQE
jgi:uncharacterized membrane protein